MNDTLKRWPGWVAVAAIAVGLVVFGTVRDSGPNTPGERVAELAERVACPNCAGESAASSRDPSAENIRQEIRALVDEGQLSDDEILRQLELSFGSRILLVPQSTGVDALVWALPAAALVVGVSALTATFLRWRREAAVAGDPTDAERALVAAALREDADPTDHGDP